MAEAVRDAKLRLTFETNGADAAQSVDGVTASVNNATEAMGRNRSAAEAAAAVLERLSQDPRTRLERAFERSSSSLASAIAAAETSAATDLHHADSLPEAKAERAYRRIEAERARSIERAVSQHEQQTSRATLEFERAMKRQQPRQAAGGQAGASVGRPGSPGSLLEGELRSLAGNFGKLAAPVLTATAAMYGLTRSLRRGSELFDTFNNRDLSRDVKDMALANYLTGGFAGQFRDIVENAMGVTARRRNTAVGYEESGVRFTAQSELDRIDRANQSRYAQARALARQYQQVTMLPQAAGAPGENLYSPQGNRFVVEGVRVPLSTRYDRDTLVGEVSHREEQSRLPFRDALAEAARQVAAARETREYEQGRTQFTVNAHETAIQNRFRAQQSYDEARRTGTRETRENAAAALHDAAMREQEAGRQRVAQLERARDAAMGERQAQFRDRQHHVDNLRNELGLTQQREERLTGAAERLGSMSYIDRNMGLQAARMLRDQGIENLSPALRAMAQNFDQDFFRAEARRFGQQTPEFRAWRQETPGSWGAAGTDSLAETREQSRRLTDQIRQASLDATAELQRGIRDIMGDFSNAIVRAMREETNRALAAARAARQEQAAANAANR